MPGILKRATGPGWFPSAEARSLPDGALPRADNLTWDEEGVVSLRGGLEKLYGPLTDTDVHSLISAVLDGVQYRVSGQGDKLYSNGVEIDSGVTFDGSGDISMDKYLGTVFAARGKTRKKFDGTNLFNWQPTKPANPPSLTADDQVPVTIASFNTAESPAFAASEGTITGTFPAGADGSANGSLELTPAATSRGTIKKTWTSDQDFLEIGGFSGSETDLFDMQVWLSAPDKVKAITVMFGLGIGSDPFADDHYMFRFNLETPPATLVTRRAPPIVVDIKSPDVVIQQISDKVDNAVASAPPPSPESDESDVPTKEWVEDQLNDSPDARQGFRFDKATNPGWFHMAVTRGQFIRIGSSPDRDWSTVRAFQVVYEAVSGTATVRFDTARIIGGGDRALTGTFRVLYKFVRASTAAVPYISKSVPSDASDYLTLEAQGMKVTIPATALQARDPQADQIWVYLTGGYLAEWYRIAVTGVVANDSTMRIDWFARNADGTISRADAMRFLTRRFSIPGVVTGYDPTTLTELKAWAKADAITGLADGDPVEIWRGSEDDYTFTPTDIATLSGWFSADTEVFSDGGVTPAGDGDTVQEWHDQSGNNFDFEQTTAAAKPVLKTNIVNGEPVLRFDGGDDYLQSKAGTTLDSFMSSTLGTVVAVFAPSSLTRDDAAEPYKNHTVWGSRGYCGLAVDTLGNVEGYSYDGVLDVVSLAYGLAVGQWAIGAWEHSTTEIYNSVNDTRIQSMAGPTTSGAISLLSNEVQFGVANVSNAGWLAGDIAEILFFDGALAQGDRVKLEQYLAAKYNITLPYGSTKKHHWYQTVSADRPVYKTNRIGGKPTVDFDGTQHYLVHDWDGDHIFSSAANQTVLAVIKPDAAALNTTPRLNNQALCFTNDRLGIEFVNNASLQAYNYDGTADGALVAAAMDEAIIVTLLHTGGNISVGKNDTRTASLTNTVSGNTTSPASWNTMGAHWALGSAASKFLDGEIAEVLIFDGALSESDRQDVESYLSSKYGISIAYPGTSTYAPDATTDDLIITITDNEIDALIRNEKMDTLESTPPDDIIGIAHYQDRVFCLTSKGLIWVSKRKDPTTFLRRHIIRIGGPSATPLWIRSARVGVFVGTTDDITSITGDGSTNLDGTINLFPRELGVSHPPVNTAAAAEGPSIIYCASDGWRTLDGDTSVPLPMDAVRMLYDGQTRYGVSPPNLSDGRFSLAVGRGSRVVALVPEGSDDTTTQVLHRFYQKRWHRHTFTPSLRSIAEEKDGSLILGDNAGNIWKLDSGTQDDGADIPVVLWTPVDEQGSPLSIKDLWEAQIQVDTGGGAATAALHLDGSGTLSTSWVITASGLLVHKKNIADQGAARATQLRLTGSFSAFRLMSYLINFRSRPQHRMSWDTGYVNVPRRGDYGWIREIRVNAQAPNNFTVKVYADGTLKTTQTVTSLGDFMFVYRVQVPRGTKATRVRVLVETAASAGTGDAGMDLAWVETRLRPSGNKSEKNFMRVHPSEVP